MIVPPFADEKQRRGRALSSQVYLSEIDVTRDIIDLKFLLKSEIDKSKIRYTLEVVKWTENVFQIYINFTHPLVISQGQERDEVKLIIRNP
jgi:hypothetical protein